MKAGIVAEFVSSAELVRAVEAIEAAGFTAYETYAPHPIEALLERRKRPRSPAYALVFGLAGAALGYGIQWATNLDYPLNVGGFPIHSAPTFVPIAFETAILFASFAVFFGTLIHLGLSRLDHPLFDVDGFERASIDRFFLAVDAGDAEFDVDRVAQTLRNARALRAVPFGRLP
jgi:hypothetical protein